MTALNTAQKPIPKAGQRRPMNIRGQRFNWTATILLLVGALTVIVPLYFAVIMALKTDQQAASGSGFDWPSPISFGNFTTA